MRLRLNTGKSLRRQILTIFNVGLVFFTLVLLFLIDQNIRNNALSKAAETQSKQATFFSTLITTHKRVRALMNRSFKDQKT